MPPDGQTGDLEKESRPGKVSAAKGQIVVEDRYIIHPDRPAPEHATSQTPAVMADDPMSPGEPRVALICDIEPLPRIEVMDKLKGLARPGLTQIAAFGPVDFPGANGQRLAVVIHPGQGGRLVAPGAATVPVMSTEMLMETVVRPIVVGLTEMFHRNQTHRGIRPDNIFFSDATQTRVVLGQAVTAPAGYYQPPAFETIECAMADPEGKGTGTRAEDMFSLGVVMLALCTGKIPGAGVDPEDMLARRIEKGSLDAYADVQALPRDLIDGLRGLMSDDSRERWGLENFKSWMEGNRVGSPRVGATIRAHHGFDFGGKKWWTAASAAMALCRRPEQGAKALRSGAVLDWMKRSLPDNIPVDALASVMADFEVSGGGTDQMLLAKASIAMDPQAPIRFSGMSVRLDGLGSAMVTAMRKPGGGALFGDLLKANLPSYWLNSQPKHVNRGIGVTAHLEKLGRWVSDGGPGAGMERCLYDLNPNLPCQSPITAGRWVSEPSELLPAIDASASAGGLSRQPIDRHIAAFLASRSHADTTQLMGLMQPQGVDEHSAIGTLRLLAELQASFKAKSLPGLGNYCAELLKPVIDTFHHRRRRAKLLEAVMAVARSGNLPALLKLIDDAEFKKIDRRGFDKARELFSRAEADLSHLERDAPRRKDEARRKGRESAALISSGLAVVTVAVLLFLKWL
jgi:eukaryotic-like serine/threonine-protein kinase